MIFTFSPKAIISNNFFFHDGPVPVDKYNSAKTHSLRRCNRENISIPKYQSLLLIF